MIAVLALALAATPVSLQLDLSKATREKAGVRLEETIRQRLIEDGFELSSPAKIVLRVDELHGVFRLTAVVASREPLTRDVTPTGNEWRDELALEIAQRLVALAHEVDPPVKKKIYNFEDDPVDSDAPPIDNDPEPKPGDDPYEAADRPGPARPPPEGDSFRIGAGIRAGIALRFPSVDPSFAVHGLLPLGTVEPELLMGLTIAPGPGLTAFEAPIAAGLRLRFFPRDAFFEVIPEALLGARMHFYGASLLDSGGARVDFIGMLGATAQIKLGGLRAGLRVGVELAPAREHLLGSETLWSRGLVSMLIQLVLERS